MPLARMSRLLAAMALTVGTLVMLSAGPASAATPQCWQEIRRDGAAPLPHSLPATRDYNTSCWLQQGSNNGGVLSLQKALKYCYNAYSGVLDGDFGPRTREALRMAQRIELIGIDGIYGPETAWNLEFAPIGSTNRADCRSMPWL